MRACVFVGPTLRAEDLPPDRRHRRPAARRPGRRLPRRAGAAARDRHHRRLLRGRARGLAQGDPLGDGRGHPRLRQRQHGRAARRRAAAVRHARGRPDLRGLSRRRARGRRRGRGHPRAAPRPATSRCPRPWSTSARPWPRPSEAASSRATTRDALVRIAKELFYHDRTFERLLERAAEPLDAPEELAALRAWLPAGRVDQKREDALAMLAAMQALLASEPEPMQRRLRARVDRGVGRCVGGFGGITDARRRRGPEWLPTTRCSRSCGSRPTIMPRCAIGRCCGTLAGREARAGAGSRSMRPWRGISLPGCAPTTACSRAPTSIAGSRPTGSTAGGSSDWSRTRRGSRRSARSPCPTLHDALLDELRLRNDLRAFAERARDKQAAARDAGARTSASGRRALGAAGVARLVFRAAPRPAAARRHRRRRARARLRGPGRSRSRAAPGMAILPRRRAGEPSMTCADFGGCPAGRDIPKEAADLVAMAGFDPAERAPGSGCFPQPPFGSPVPLETVWVSSPAGSVGPGPADERMYAIDPLRQAQPYGIELRPVRHALSLFSALDGPDRAAGAARTGTAISTISSSACLVSRWRTCSVASDSRSTCGRATSAARSHGISARATTGWRLALLPRLRQRPGRLRLSRGRAVHHRQRSSRSVQPQLRHHRP